MKKLKTGNIYRIYRQRDGAVDGDYQNIEWANDAKKLWESRFPNDNFMILLIKQKVDADYWQRITKSEFILSNNGIHTN